ncbi:hypothetical protein TNCT_251991 [Trichonephila clavata]|uniref:Uncharacterized protein n=1 Tax=Trichonephila clavata TaxID=2740835 RepID=A0A8X6GHG7_TRICU|nr:hypothetical protein TNCT_251991 [Trichonephila clavata]
MASASAGARILKLDLAHSAGLSFTVISRSSESTLLRAGRKEKGKKNEIKKTIFGNGTSEILFFYDLTTLIKKRRPLPTLFWNGNFESFLVKPNLLDKLGQKRRNKVHLGVHKSSLNFIWESFKPRRRSLISH